MPAALARHDAILRAAVEDQRGRIIKTTGDGMLAVLEDPLAAVNAAVAAQRTLAREDSSIVPLKVRIGMHTGVAEYRDGDYYGSEVNRGARLMAVAHGGQVVMSHVTAEQVRARLDHSLTLVDLGEHRLRGLSRPERVYQLSIAGLADAFPPLQSVDAFLTSIPLREPTFARADDELAGRDRELARLNDAWHRAVDGTGQIVLLAGEPGIGKTRLAAELARRAHAEGAVALYGRSDEEAIVPYQPFVEALRPVVAAVSPATIRERLHGLEADLARVFPELIGRVTSAPNAIRGDPETEQYRLFEAMTTLLTGATIAQPAVLVLDDLQWADSPTVLLLKHLVRASQHHALLVICCYRDVELPRGHPLSDLLTHLRREPCATWIELRGLSESESATLLHAVVQHDLSESVLEALHRGTGGNPFFLEELLRHLVETGVLFDDGGTIDVNTLELPAGIREVVVRRLARLAAAVNEVLSLAAVMGPTFEALALARAAELPPTQILEHLDTAVTAGLIAEDPGIPGAYAFAHALIRQTLYTELGPTRRKQLHARVAEALESGDMPIGASTLAYHYSNALPLVDAGRATEYLARAGHEAALDLAFEDGVGFFERALDLLARSAPGDAARRVALLIDRSDSLVNVDERAGVEAAFGAVREARALGSAEELARAVIVFAEPSYAAFAYPTDVEELLGEAVAGLGDEHPGLRARLLAIQAFHLASYQVPGRDAGALGAAALELARVADDPLTLAFALLARATSIEGSPDVTARLSIAEELVTLGHRLGPMPWTFGLRVAARAHLEMGDAAELDSTLGELASVGTEMRWLPARLFHAQWGATQALMEGRFEDIEEFANTMHEHARAYQAAAGMLAVQRFYLARERGDAMPVETRAQVAYQHVETIYPRAMYASSLFLSGDANGAAEMLDTVAAHDFYRDGQESGWPAGLALFTEIAVSVDSPHCRALRELLEPFTGHLVVALAALACLGSADRYLGMLSTQLGDHERALEHLERADAAERAIGGRALVPRTNLWRARAHLARGGAGDTESARALLAEVVQSAGALGMRRVAAEAAELASL